MLSQFGREKAWHTTKKLGTKPTSLQLQETKETYLKRQKTKNLLITRPKGRNFETQGTIEREREREGSCYFIFSRLVFIIMGKKNKIVEMGCKWRKKNDKKEWRKWERERKAIKHDSHLWREMGLPLWRFCPLLSVLIFIISFLE